MQLLCQRKYIHLSELQMSSKIPPKQQISSPMKKCCFVVSAASAVVISLPSSADYLRAQHAQHGEEAVPKMCSAIPYSTNSLFKSPLGQQHKPGAPGWYFKLINHCLYIIHHCSWLFPYLSAQEPGVL